MQARMSEFVVNTEAFEGPVGKLLELIRKRELYINDISLAKVTDAYLAHIAEHEESLDSMAEFVRIAATLAVAKSKSLLPDATTKKEEADIDELEDRLRAYRLVKNRAKHLQETFGDQPAFASEAQPQQPEDIFAPGNTLTTEKLVASVADCIVDLPDESLPQARIDDPVSLQEEITRLQDRCQEIEQANFHQIARSGSKYHQTVSFVAVLELVKAGRIQATQARNFAPITIRPHDD